MARVKQDYVVVDPKGKHTTLTIENVGLIPILARVRSVNVTAYSINPTYYLIHPNGSQDVTVGIHVPRHIDPLHDAFKVATLTLPQKFLERVKTETGARKSPSDTVCRTLWEEIIATYNPVVKDIIVPTRSVGVLGTYQAKLAQDTDDLNTLKEEIERLIAIQKKNDKLLQDMETKGIVIQSRKNHLMERLSCLQAQLDSLGVSRVMGQMTKSKRILAHYLFIIFLLLASTLGGYALL